MTRKSSAKKPAGEDISGAQAPEGGEGPAGAKTVAQDTAPPAETAPVLVLRVIGPKSGRRRAGRRFGPEPVDIPLEELTLADLEALGSDPMLVCSTIEAEAPAPSKDGDDS